MTLTERYDKLCSTPSSINEHLPTLRRYASQCKSVSEFGVDIGQSTTAFLMAQPELLISVDLVLTPEIVQMAKDCTAQIIEFSGDGNKGFCCRVGKTHWDLYLDDSRTFSLHPVDLLFIDSAHSYDQMSAELARHAGQVRKFIICHDTFSFGEWGEAGPPQVGIVPAIGEFLVAHPEWVEREHFSFNNGLQVLERINGTL